MNKRTISVVVVLLIFTTLSYGRLVAQRSIATSGIIISGNADFDITFDEQGLNSVTEFLMGDIIVGVPVEGDFWIQNKGEDMNLTVHLSDPSWDALEGDISLRWNFPEEVVLISGHSTTELTIWATVTRHLPGENSFVIIFHGEVVT